MDVLQNLQKLVLVGEAAWRMPLEIERYMMTLADSPVDQRMPSSSLTTLKEVVLVGEQDSHDRTVDDLFMVALLPNLRTLRCHAICYRRVGSTPRPSLKIGFQHLYLSDSHVTTKRFDILLHSIEPNILKTFHYEVGDIDHGQDVNTKAPDDCCAQGIADVLIGCARESLETIHVVAAGRANWVEYENRRMSIGSLHPFTRLKHVHVESHMLIDQPELRRRQTISAGHDRGTAGVDDTPGMTEGGKSIIGCLPKSLEILELVVRDSLAVPLEEMLAGVEMGCTALPHLRQVIIQKIKGDEITLSNWPPSTQGPYEKNLTNHLYMAQCAWQAASNKFQDSDEVLA
ncbi:MAG: hypothetical protein Q9168_007576 [Polycauliona sp. 1 TL-2023]